MSHSNEPDRTVVGITADLGGELDPEQWVNLYQLDPIQGEAEIHYRGKYQVKDLSIVLADQALAQFVLEPLDEQGNVISVQQALDNTIPGDE
jgi:hypothetical protein